MNGKALIGNILTGEIATGAVVIGEVVTASVVIGKLETDILMMLVSVTKKEFNF